jgi:hypothetical protein
MPAVNVPLTPIVWAFVFSPRLRRGVHTRGLLSNFAVDKIIFVIWIIFTLIVVLILLCCRKKEMPTSSRSPLYEKTKQRVDDFYAKLEKEQLMPWIFFNTGKMPEVKKYYGGTIKSWIILTLAEKPGFLMRETVGVRQKTIISRQDSLLVSIFG